MPSESHTREEMAPDDSDKAIASGNDQNDSLVDVSIEFPTGCVINVGFIPGSETCIVLVQFLADALDSSTLTSYKFRAVREGKENVVTEFNDISSYVSVSDSNGASLMLSVVFEHYNLRTARDHVKRLRSVFENPASTRLGVDLGNGFKFRSDIEGATKFDGIAGTNQGNGKVEESIPDLLNCFGAIRFENFFDETLLSMAHGNNKYLPNSTLSDCINSITFSGWNPPPPSRQMQGDLFYLEVVSAVEGTVFVTASYTGFFISKSTRNIFDPSPAANPYHSFILLNTLLDWSPSLRSAWENLLSISKTYSNRKSSPSAHDGDDIDANSTETEGIFAEISVAYTSSLIENSTVQWNAVSDNVKRKLKNGFGKRKNTQGNIRSAADDCGHKWDLTRAHDELGNTFGSAVFSPPREWNDEIQSVREMPSNEPHEKLNRQKYLNKITDDFISASKLGAISIIDGHVIALNPADSPEYHVYLFNNIFFSRALDSKDSYKLCSGHEAARKYASIDLRNQKIIHALGIDELRPIMTAIIDHKGSRIVAQTVIPGILSSGAGTARLLYGCLEYDKKLSCKEKAMKIMREIASKLHLTSRNIAEIPLSSISSELQNSNGAPPIEKSNPDCQQTIRIDDDDEIAPSLIQIPEGSESKCSNQIRCINHIGPIEAKLLEGADGRIYFLEFLRLTPRDANYVKGHKGTELIDEYMLSAIDSSLLSCYVFRQELVIGFIQRTFIESRKAILLEAFCKQRLEKFQKLKLEGTQTNDIKATTSQENNDEVLPAKEMESVTDESDPSISESAGFQLNPEVAQQLQSLQDEADAFKINPNCFFSDVMGFRADVDSSVESSDEETARKLGRFLWEVLLPYVTDQIQTTEVVIHEGASMTSYLHSLGVNMRYLGQLARLARDREIEDLVLFQTGRKKQNPMPTYWLELLETEMIARSLKHLFSKSMREDSSVRSSPALTISSTLNYLFGNPADSILTTFERNAGEEKTSKGDEALGKKKDKKSKTRGKIEGLVDISSEVPPPPLAYDSRERTRFFEDLQSEVKKRFAYSLVLLKFEEPNSTDDSRFMLDSRIWRLALLRRICQLCGIRIATREYLLGPYSTSEVIELMSSNSNKSNKNETSKRDTPLSVDSFCLPFGVNDILALVPKVKTCEPENLMPEIVEFEQSAKSYIQQGNIQGAVELTQEAIQWAQMVTDGPRKEMINSYGLLSSLLSNAGDHASALSFSGRSISIAAQLYGLDSTQVLQHHLQIGAIYAELGNHSAAITHMLAARYVAHFLGGPHHPEIINILTRIAGVYKSCGEIDAAAVCLAECHARMQNAGDQISHAVILQNLAETQMIAGNHQEAVGIQKQALALISQIFGPEDERTLETKTTLEKYVRAATEIAVSIARKKQADEENEKLRQRSNWLDEEISRSGSAGIQASKQREKGGNKKKKSGRKA